MLPEDLSHFRNGLRRVLAAGLDFLVLAPLFAVDHSIWASSLDPATQWILASATAASYALYAPVGHALFGQTVGKRLTKVQVLDLGGERITWARALARDIVPLLAAGYWCYAYARDLQTGNLPATPGFQISQVDIWVQVAQSGWLVAELVTMLFNARRRALHDFIAGTVVVRIDG